jgi:hypothetical protein
MRNAAFIAVGLLLLLVQGNLSRVLAPFGLHGWTPSLLLPLVAFLGVHEPSMARGSLLSFVLGHGFGLIAAAPAWLFTFTYVALWWLGRVAGVRLAAQTIPTQMGLAFGFSLVESLIVLIVLVIFGADPQRPVEIATVVLPHAVATALVAPPIFRIAERLHQSTAVVPRVAESGR